MLSSTRVCSVARFGRDGLDATLTLTGYGCVWVPCSREALSPRAASSSLGGFHRLCRCVADRGGAAFNVGALRLFLQAIRVCALVAPQPLCLSIALSLAVLLVLTRQRVLERRCGCPHKLSRGFTGSNAARELAGWPQQ